MTVELSFSSRELAYLLGSVGGMLLQQTLTPEHRLPLTRLRDRLAPYVALDAGLLSTLGCEAERPLQ